MIVNKTPINSNNVKMKNKDIAEAIIVNEKNEVLLQKKTPDYKFAPGVWTFFGGRIEENESPEQALKREIKEEINFDIKEFNLFKIRAYEFPPFGVRGKRYIFEVFFHGDLSQISIKEGNGFAFFAAHEVDFIKMQKFVLEDLKELLTLKRKGELS